MPLHRENQTGASSMTIREMSCPDILSRFPLSKSEFPVTSCLNTNTHCRVSPLLGAERGLYIFLSHFPLHFLHLVLHEPCPLHLFSHFLSSPTKNYIESSDQPASYHIHTLYILYTCFHTWQCEELIVEVTLLHFQKAEL